MSAKTAASSSGISIGGLLGCIFVTLKLCGVIAWSWWWVTAPFWAPVALVLAIFAASVVVAGIATILGRG